MSSVSEQETDSFFFGWRNVTEFPYQFGGQYHAVKLNDYEFIVVPSIEIYEKTAILKYNIYTKKWTEIWKSDGRMKSDRHTVLINENKDKLYLYASGGYLIEIDLKTGQYLINYDFRKLIDNPGNTKLIKCDDKYRLIESISHRYWSQSCTVHQQKIITFDIISKDELKVDIISTVEHEYKTDYDTPSIKDAFYFKDKMKVCILGCDKALSCTNKIHFHSIINGDDAYDDKISEFPTGFSTVLITTDEKYMIIFGGGEEGKHNIYIMNLDRMDIKLSSIACPEEYSMGAMLMNEKGELVTGFINDVIKDCPFEIIELIQNWYGRHCIYLFIIIATHDKRPHYQLYHCCMTLGEILYG